ncbi:reactive oxygen species modulator 1 [Daktulosphaira vitifoliae]|uniref:reactive oxygen species modulator 1 n=1 Tax=Daktulosphaira vitifoliae TaxID=58002 RepID=UPI0021AA3052|nr:reactive oxygen species modulator 1 [Daktulosphaira vitifoliae]
MVPPPTGIYGQKPSCYDKISNSFIMGATIGITIGMLFGGLSAFRSGFRGTELVGKMGITMMQSGGTFGTFMGVGAAIRC